MAIDSILFEVDDPFSEDKALQVAWEITEDGKDTLVVFNLEKQALWDDDSALGCRDRGVNLHRYNSGDAIRIDIEAGKSARFSSPWFSEGCSQYGHYVDCFDTEGCYPVSHYKYNPVFFAGRLVLTSNGSRDTLHLKCERQNWERINATIPRVVRNWKSARNRMGFRTFDLLGRHEPLESVFPRATRIRVERKGRTNALTEFRLER